MDELVVWWTLSSLLQGMCAVYGLLLVFYVYQRSKAYEYVSRLEDKVLVKGPSVRAVAGNWGSRFCQAAAVERREVPVLWLLAGASCSFVVAVCFDVAGLVWKDAEWLFWVGVGLSVLFMCGIGISFAVVSVRAVVLKGTAAYGLVREGWDFFEKGEVRGERFDLKDIDEASKRVWNERIGKWRDRYRE